MSEDISALNGMTTETLSLAFTAGMGLLLAFLMCLYFDWRTCLWNTLLSPVILIGVYGMNKLQWRSKNSKARADGKNPDGQDYVKANGLLSDVILNFKTCISFGNVSLDKIIDKFESLLIEPSKLRIKNAHYNGILFGYAQGSRILFLGLVFFIASKTVANNPQLEKQNIFTCIWILFMAAFGIGASISNLPSINKAKTSAEIIFEVIDEKSTLDVRKPHQD